jgi:hypothetical protein
MNQPQPPDSQAPKLKLLDEVRTTIRLRGMSYRAEQSYVELLPLAALLRKPSRRRIAARRRPALK